MNDDTISNDLERLVDGSLGFEEGRAILNWIDGEAPWRWRDLGLAYFERDVLRSAVHSNASLLALPPLRQTGGPRQGARIARWTLAACFVVAAFVSGWAAGGSGSSPAKPPRAAASATPATPDRPAPVTGIPGPEVTESAAALREINATLAPKGYEAAIATRYFSKDLGDGRRLFLPINKFVVHRRGE